MATSISARSQLQLLCASRCALGQQGCCGSSTARPWLMLCRAGAARGSGSSVLSSASAPSACCTAVWAVFIALKALPSPPNCCSAQWYLLGTGLKYQGHCHGSECRRLLRYVETSAETARSAERIEVFVLFWWCFWSSSCS